MGGAPVKEQLQGTGEAKVIQESFHENIFMQVADLKDVHALFSKMEAEGPDLPAHLFLIAPKIDFRQISAPNFLADS